MIVLDLDGTVVPFGDHFAAPSLRVRQAIERAIAAGAVVTVATGRAVWDALPTVRALGLPNISLVCSNGAIGYDIDSSSVLFQTLFDPRPVAHAVLAVSPNEGFAVEYGTEGYVYTSRFVRDEPAGFLREVSLEELIARPTSRMLCSLSVDGYTTPHIPLDSELRVRQKVAISLMNALPLDTKKYSIKLGYAGWIDISDAGVDKGTGLAEIAHKLNISAAETAVIGDDNNDLPMFAWAGYSVAMGRSPDKVLAAADEVTADLASDGVAVMLEKWFPPREL